MAKMMLELSHDEVNREIPYVMVCMGRYGSTWGTMHRKRRWAAEFTEREKKAATKLFAKSHEWTLTRGVPDSVVMRVETFKLWQKLGDFLSSI